MSRFGSLGIEGIQRFAADREAAGTAPTSWFAIVEKVTELVTDRFRANARLTPAELEHLFAEADDLMATRYHAFRQLKAHIPATRTRPKGDKREAIYLSLLHEAETRTYRLVSFHLTGTCKKLRFNTMCLPFCFSEHAVQRVMERVPQEEQALKVTADSLIDWALHLIPLHDLAQEQNDGCMGIPAVGGIGLFLGEFIPDETGPQHLGYEWTNKLSRPVEPNKYLVNGPIYLIRTFVNTAKLRPEQLRSMNLMAHYQAEHQEAADQLRNSLFWPDAEVINKNLPPDHEQQAMALSNIFRETFVNNGFTEGLRRGRDDATPQEHWRQDRLSRLHVPQGK